MTIEEKIASLENHAKLCERNGMYEWKKECEQYVAWLRELVERRKAPKIIHCSECANFFKDNGSTVGYCERKAQYRYTDYFCGDAERRTDE